MLRCYSLQKVKSSVMENIIQEIIENYCSGLESPIYIYFKSCWKVFEKMVSCNRIKATLTKAPEITESRRELTRFNYKKMEITKIEKIF